MVNISEKNTKIAGNETKKTLFKKTKIDLHFGRDLVQKHTFLLLTRQRKVLTVLTQDTVLGGQERNRRDRRWRKCG